MRRLWKRWDTRLCLIVILVYAAAALYGEVVYRAARLNDRTPTYNTVREQSRYAAGLCTARGVSAPVRRASCLICWAATISGATCCNVWCRERIAFHVGIITSLIAIPLGVLLGCLGGYFGGRVDSIVVWLCATVASMPGLLFILAIAMVVGQGWPASISGSA